MSKKKVLAILKPINQNCVSLLYGKYVDHETNKIVVITEGSTVEKMDYEGQKPLRPKFVAFDRASVVYKVSVDTNQPKEALERRIAEANREIEAWLTHDQVIDGRNVSNDPNLPHFNANLRKANFVVEIPDEMIKTKNSNTRQKFEAAALLNDMSFQDLRAVAFYFGINPLGMEEEELYNVLCNFENGVVMTDPNLTKFLNEFGVPTDKLVMDIYIRKAIAMSDSPVEGFGPVFTKSGASYYLDGKTYLGKSAEGIVEYFSEKETHEIYKSYVVKAVDEREGKETKTVEKTTKAASKPSKKGEAETN
jgi:hypothetical protein